MNQQLIIALTTVKYWLKENAGYDMTIVICCYDDETYVFTVRVQIKTK